MSACFRDDLDPALYGVFQKPISSVVIECLTGDRVLDAVDCREHILHDMLKLPGGHQNTRIAELSMRVRKRG